MQIILISLPLSYVHLIMIRLILLPVVVSVFNADWIDTITVVVGDIVTVVVGVFNAD